MRVLTFSFYFFLLVIPAFGQENSTSETVYQQALDFYEGNGVTRDVQQAARLAKAAAKQGYAPAQSLFGYLHAQGEGARQSWSRAAYWWKKAVEQEYTLAFYNLAMLYHLGVGVDEDQVQAREYLLWVINPSNKVSDSFNDFALLGSIQTQSAQILGRMYQEGLGVEKDPVKAAEWMEKAAVSGSYPAMLQTGLFYALGEGVEQDAEKADLYFNMAINSGREISEQEAKTFFLEGVKNEKRYNEALEDLRNRQRQAVSLLQSTCGVTLFINTDKEDEKSFGLAAHWLELAVESDVATAKAYLGLIHVKNLIDGADFKRGVKLLNEAAEDGVALAEYNLAVLYFQGNGVSKEVETSRRLFKHAARASFYPALAAIEDPAEAMLATPAEMIDLTRQASDAGNQIARACLGRALVSGFSLEQDRQEGIRTLTQLAEEGVAEAQYILGLTLLNDVEIEGSSNRGLNWLKQAAEQGHLWAKFETARTIRGKADDAPTIGEELIAVTIVGAFFLAGESRKELQLAAQYYQDCIDQDITDALTLLGLMYIAGQGVKKDLKKGESLFEQAVEKGDFNGHAFLGIFNYFGFDRRSENDPAKAIPHLRIAAENKHAFASFCLGDAYETGNEVKEDRKKAMVHYRVAAQSGHAESAYRLGLFFKDGKSIYPNFEEAVRWFRVAVSRGHSMAYYHLLEMYELGWGVERDEARAYKAYKGFRSDPPNVQFILGYARCELLKRGVKQTRINFVSERLKNVYKNGVSKGEAAAYLGVCYFRRAHMFEKVSKKYTKLSEESFNRSVELGSAVGMTELAKLHLNGKWLDASLETAVDLLQNAADQHYPEAAYLLAKAVIEGQTDLRSREDCIQLLELAVMGSIEGAEALLDSLNADLNESVPVYSGEGTPS